MNVSGYSESRIVASMKYNLISFILIIVFFDTDLNLFLFNDSLSKVKYYSFFESDNYKDIPVLKPI